MSDDKRAVADTPLACLVLFDIDGTLLGAPDSGPTAGLLSMNRAAEDLSAARNPLLARGFLLRSTVKKRLGTTMSSG